jgi:hypothetical protein
MAGNNKQIITSTPVITNGDMSQSSITSLYTNIQGLDNSGYHINFSGAPVGTFSVQVSGDYQPGKSPNSNPVNPGHWITLPLSPAITASGSPDSAFIDLNQLAAPWIRIIYNRTSGTGTLNVFVMAKSI